MPAGIILTQVDLDNMIGSVARQVNQLMVEQIPLIHTKIAELSGVSGMVALPQGGRFSAMTTDEAGALSSAMDELNALAGVFVGSKLVASGGTVTDGSGHDFRLYLQAVYGFGF